MAPPGLLSYFSRRSKACTVLCIDEAIGVMAKEEEVEEIASLVDSYTLAPGRPRSSGKGGLSKQPLVASCCVWHAPCQGQGLYYTNFAALSRGPFPPHAAAFSSYSSVAKILMQIWPGFRMEMVMESIAHSVRPSGSERGNAAVAHTHTSYNRLASRRP